MLLVGALVLAFFVLPEPWSYVAVIAAAIAESLEAWFFIRWTRRRRPAVGAEAFVGRTAEVVEPLRPAGRVRIDGELWNARSATSAVRGEIVRVTGVDRLTLLVETDGR